MFLKALLAFLIAPTVVGGVIPFLITWYDSYRGSGSVVGWALLAAGVAAILWAVREFYVAGKGTLAPWAPPKHLVTSGPFRFSRNPMYVAVIVIIGGWAIAFGSPVCGGYAGLALLLFHLRIVLNEEIVMAGRFPSEWVEYKSKVPRWLFV